MNIKHIVITSYLTGLFLKNKKIKLNPWNYSYDDIIKTNIRWILWPIDKGVKIYTKILLKSKKDDTQHIEQQPYGY